MYLSSGQIGSGPAMLGSGRVGSIKKFSASGRVGSGHKKFIDVELYI
jgi:hypothetical protein